MRWGRAIIFCNLHVLIPSILRNTMFLVVSAPSGVPKSSGKPNFLKVSGPEIHGIMDFQATKRIGPCSFEALKYSQLTKEL